MSLHQYQKLQYIEDIVCTFVNLSVVAWRKVLSRVKQAAYNSDLLTRKHAVLHVARHTDLLSPVDILIKYKRYTQFGLTIFGNLWYIR
jgi:hypothetical protein